MTIRIEATPYGASALDRLMAAIADLKRDDPMAPVTVLVPNSLAGVVARRSLPPWPGIVSSAELVESLRRLADGGTALDPEVVRQLLASASPSTPG